jgi:hypothetical protein
VKYAEENCIFIKALETAFLTFQKPIPTVQISPCMFPLNDIVRLFRQMNGGAKILPFSPGGDFSTISNEKFTEQAIKNNLNRYETLSCNNRR